MSDEHGNLGSVFGRVKDLPGKILLSVPCQSEMQWKRRTHLLLDEVGLLPALDAGGVHDAELDVAVLDDSAVQGRRCDEAPTFRG